MCATGSFAYKPDNTRIHGFILPAREQVQVEAMNHNIAPMYVTDSAGNQQPLALNDPY